MARKGENIYKRKDGRWEGRCRTGRLSGGKAGYISVYGKSYREVKEKLFVKKGEQLAGKKAGGRLPAGITVREAVDLWIEERKGGWKESTLATYRSIAEKHILPELGRTPVAALDGELYKRYFEKYRVRGDGSCLSEGYLHQIHILFGQIFRVLEEKYHCRLPELPSSCFAVKKGPPPAASHAPEEGSIRRLEAYLLKEAEHGDHTCLGILLSGCSGIRIGELCALQWKDIQFEKGTLAIRKTMQRIRTFETVWAEGKPVTRTGTKVVVAGPKSRNSNREIPLPEHLLKLLEKMSGVKEGYVMPGKKKEYTEPRTLQYRFQRILKELGIPAFNFHMLRHIFATNCIMQGFDMKSLSEILWHSNVSTTMRIYVHSDMERKKQLMAGYRMAVA